MCANDALNQLVPRLKWSGDRQESMDNYRPKGAGSGKAGTEVPVKLGSSIETVQEAANWLYHLVYESLLAMTTMCSSNGSRRQITDEFTPKKSSWLCMVGPRQTVYMVTAVLVTAVLLNLTCIVPFCNFQRIGFHK